MVHVLHAAGRNADVEQVAAEARKVDPSSEMNSAIDTALKAKD
jgi:hypothetical protein